MQNKTFFKRIYLYSKERFNLLQFIPLSIILGGVLAIGTQTYLNQNILIVPILLSATALFCFFLRLRIFDEFKDYDHDVKYYSHRPVPRGLVSKNELISFLIPLIFLEIIIALISSKDSLILFIISFIYSLLMFKEFFVKDWIKKHFTTYILSHEILLFPLFFYLCAINGFKLTFINDVFYWFLVIYIGLSMFLLEITRKVRPRETEIASKDTYTAQYGIVGTSILLLGISLGIVISLNTFIILLDLNYVPVIIVSLLFLTLFYWKLYKFNNKPSIETSKNVFLYSIYFVFISCITAILILIKL